MAPASPIALATLPEHAGQVIDLDAKREAVLGAGVAAIAAAILCSAGRAAGRRRSRAAGRAGRPDREIASFVVPDELFLIDGNSLAYRAFFALPESIATSTGRPTNAIFGFASMLVKILTDYGPKATVVVWDAGHSGRKEVYTEYKAQRSSGPICSRSSGPISSRW